MKPLKLPELPPFQPPKELGAVADELFQLKEQRGRVQKIADAIEEREKLLKAWVIDNLPKSKSTGVSGQLATVTIVTKDIPTAKDWDKIYAFILKHKSFDLLQRRLAEGSVKERWENDETIPGIEHFNAVTVSVTKV